MPRSAKSKVIGEEQRKAKFLQTWAVHGYRRVSNKEFVIQQSHLENELAECHEEVPFNFFIAFSAKGDYQLLLVFWMLGLVAIFYAYRALRSAGIGSKILNSSPFHFLLYLCAVEIAPVLLLVKLAIMQKA